MKLTSIFSLMPSCINRAAGARRGFVPFVFSIMLAGILAAGCGKTDRMNRKSVDAAPRSFSIFYTCDTRGNLKPCECKDGDAGGVARRMTMLDSLRTSEHLLVDAGDVAGGGRSWEVSDYTMLLSAYDVMGYHAVNLGAREASISSSVLKEMSALHPYLVSANLADRTGKLIAEPFRIITLKNGVRAGIIGVVDDRIPAPQLGDGIQVLPLDDAIIQWMPELKKQSDVVVMLAFVDDQRLRELASVFFEVNVLIGGKVSQPQTQPEKVNRTFILRMTDQGKHIGRLDVEMTGGEITKTSADTSYLGHDVADAPAMSPIVKLYEAMIEGNSRSNNVINSEPGLKSLEVNFGE